MGTTTIVAQPEDELLSCLRSACIITVQSADGIERRWLPITRQEKTVAAISVVSKSLDSSAQVMLNAFFRIFENYLVILHEKRKRQINGSVK